MYARRIKPSRNVETKTKLDCPMNLIKRALIYSEFPLFIQVVIITRNGARVVLRICCTYYNY